jgi:hypothetical protein
VKLVSKILIGLGLAALPAMCTPFSIGMNGAQDWYGMQWNSLGGTISGIIPGTSYVSSGGTTVLATSPSSGPLTTSWSFTFTAGGGKLKVTDLGTVGDQFRVFIDGDVNGVLTSVPFTNGTSCPISDDPFSCYTNAGSSTSLFNLSAGLHTLTMSDYAVNNQVSSGLGAFRLEQNPAPPVPEPTTVGLMGLGLAGLLLRWRAKRS